MACVFLCVVVLIDPDGTLLWHCVTAGSGQVWQILLLQCTRTNKKKEQSISILLQCIRTNKERGKIHLNLPYYATGSYLDESTSLQNEDNLLNPEYIYEPLWKMAMYCPQGSGTLRQQLLMRHGIAGYCMVLHGIAGYCMVLHGIAWHCMVLHGIKWY